MAYKMKITDQQTGESVIWEDKEYHYNDYMWEDGNYSCDCNRELFFKRVKGEDPELEETQCNVGPNRYLAELVQ